MTGFINISGSDENTSTGSRSIGPWSIEGQHEVDETVDLALASGDNNITIPANAVCAVIVPPAGSPALDLRTNLNSSDAIGLPLAVVASNLPPLPTVYPLPAAASELIIHAASATTGLYVLFV